MEKVYFLRSRRGDNCGESFGFRYKEIWYCMKMMYNFEWNCDEVRGIGWGEFCNNCEMLRLCVVVDICLGIEDIF